MKLGFGPYSDWAYDEVLGKNPSYAKSPIAKGRRGNSKGRFTHWAMASMVDFLLGEVEGLAIVADPTTPEQSKEEELEKHEDNGRRTKAKPYVNLSLKNLLAGGR